MSKRSKEEEDCDCYAVSRTEKNCPPVRNVTHPLRLMSPTMGTSYERYYEFTQDEVKALEECDKESFYQRCLPFSTLFATVTYSAIRYGCLSRNPHFGVMPKVMAAAIVGYCYGRVSYIKTCENKLRRLPKNSHLGNVMRKYHAERNRPPCPKK